MEFSQLRLGAYVKLNPELNLDLFSVAMAGYGHWVDEPLNCSLEIVSVFESMGVTSVSVECVNNCGLHSICAMDEETYENIQLVCGKNLFVQVTMQDIMEELDQLEYDIKTETENIIERLMST